MGAAAQLARPLPVADLDHPHHVAVLLAEQRHRAEPLGLVTGGLDRAHRVVGGDPAGHEPLDRGKLVVGQPLAVGEVEAQLVGTDVGAGLAHVVAELAAQRRV